MRHPALLLAAAALLAACNDQPATTEATSRAPQQQVVSTDASSFATGQNIQALRAATIQFHDFKVAKAAGWATQITGCMADAGGSGAMGFHYGNTALIDGTVSVEKPQLLLYEPGPRGLMRLVGVEYIIPYTFHAREAKPPKLFGREFQQVDAFQLWGLHAWAWKTNPDGMFASWNPNVSCVNATSVMHMTHE